MYFLLTQKRNNKTIYEKKSSVADDRSRVEEAKKNNGQKNHKTGNVKSFNRIMMSSFMQWRFRKYKKNLFSLHRNRKEDYFK